MGVGDMSVGKRVKDMVRAFYGRTGAYDEALAMGDDSALAATLARNVYGAADDQVARRLARYVRATVEALGGQAVDDLAAGRVRFPDPDATACTRTSTNWLLTSVSTLNRGTRRLVRSQSSRVGKKKS